MSSRGRAVVAVLAVVVSVSQIGLYYMLPGSLPPPPAEEDCRLRLPTPAPPGAPTTAAPTTLEPTTEAPETDEPETDAPTTRPPRTRAPPPAPTEFSFLRIAPNASSNYTVFGTVSDFSAVGDRTEAMCECYDGSCTLHITNVVFKRISPGRLIIRASDVRGGSDSEAVAEVLRNCRNNFALCDEQEPSVFCQPGITYDLSSKQHRTSKYDFSNQHVLLTSRALKGQLYHDLVYPRGLLLNWAIGQLAVEHFCRGTSRCTMKMAAVQLLTDLKSPHPDLKVHGTKQNVVPEIESLLGFPDPQYLHLNQEKSAKWMTVSNRILRFEGRLFRKVAEGIELLRNKSAEQRMRFAATTEAAAASAVTTGPVVADNGQAATSDPSPPAENTTAGEGSSNSASGGAQGGSEGAKSATGASASGQEGGNAEKLPPATAMQPPRETRLLEAGAVPIHFITSRRVLIGRRWRGFASKVQSAIVARLPDITGRPVVVHDSVKRAAAKESFSQQLAWIMNGTYFVCEEGAQLTWIALANPRTTWVTLAEFAPGFYVNVMRYHVRTWLLRRDQRLVAYLIEGDLEGGLDLLFDELARPYSSSIAVISRHGILRCDSVTSCANRLDFSLLVDPRGAYPNPLSQS